MDYSDRSQQLGFSAVLQYSEPPSDWTVAMHVEPHQQGFQAQVKYHFKMCFDLAMHLTIADETSPLWTTLNYLFNFALLELRLAEFKYLDYLIQKKFIGFEFGQPKLLFVLAQSFFRVRETLKSQHVKLFHYKMHPKMFDTGDQPFLHHSEKELMKSIFESIRFVAHVLDKGVLIFKEAQEKVDQDFWEQMACRLGFVIHMLNRVMVVTAKGQ